MGEAPRRGHVVEGHALTDATPVQVAFQNYARVIGAAMPRLPETFVGEAEGDAQGNLVQVERAAMYAAALDRWVNDFVTSAASRLLAAAVNGPPADVRIIDRAGSGRGVYRPLLVYGWLQSFRLLYEVLPGGEFSRWDDSLRAWCDTLEAELTRHRVGGATLPAARAGAAAEAAWAALALFVAGRVFVRDAWTDLASDTFGRLVRAQTPEGSFSAAGPGDSPDLFWYHELILLHAAAGYAVQSEDRGVAGAVMRATDFHLGNTQPDHATNQPWGLFAFIWNPQTRPLADQMLHALGVSSPAGAEGVSLILLADALYCLRLFESPP